MHQYVSSPSLSESVQSHNIIQFPWLGLSCAVLALSTVFLSFLVLRLIDHKPELSNKMLKPASWLSALLSFNSIALHIVLSEGVTTAWWYKASRSDTTMRELHETWKMGTSTWAVIWSGKRFNYVALATVFVATVPLNGFLLQTAITMVPSTYDDHTTLYLPLVSELPLGFSSDMTDGKLGSPSEQLFSALSSLEGLSTLPPGVNHIFAFATDPFQFVGCKNKDNSAVCKHNVTIAGFNMNCSTRMDQSYDMLAVQESSTSSYNVTVFNSSVTWDPTHPNLISLDMLYKPNQTCQGQFERTKCEFRVAQMELPIQINSDQGFTVGQEYSDADDSYPVISIDANTTTAEFGAGPEILPYAGEGSINSTYGGIAHWLMERFDGSITWTYDKGKWSSSRTGQMAASYQTNDYIYPYPINLTDDAWSEGWETFNPLPNNKTWCRNTYQGLDLLTDIGYSVYDLPTNVIYKQLNQVMLGASVAQATYNLWTNVPEDLLYSASGEPGWNKILQEAMPESLMKIEQCDQSQNILRYKVKWAYWAASVTITICIIVGLMPLFYGFWRLDRRATLSPFETAAAFRAPALEGTDLRKGAEYVLQDMGKRSVHDQSFYAQQGVMPAAR